MAKAATKKAPAKKAAKATDTGGNRRADDLRAKSAATGKREG